MKKIVSLNKISKSAVQKFAALSVLAILALGFFIFPLSALADDCGKQQITVTNYIDGTQLINYATQLIKGNAKAPTFQSYKGATLPNGSIVVGTHQLKKGAAPQPALAVIVNGKAVGIGNDAKGIAMATGSPQLLNAKTVAPLTTAATKNSAQQLTLDEASPLVKEVSLMTGVIGTLLARDKYPSQL